MLCVLLLLALLLCAAPQHRNAMDKARRHVSFTLAAALIFFGLVALQLPLDEPLSTRLPEDLASYVPAARPGTWSGQEEETMPFVLMGLAAFCACAAALVTDCWGRCAPAPPDVAAKPAAPPPAPPKKGCRSTPRRGRSATAARRWRPPRRFRAARGHPARRDPQVDAHVRSPRSPGKNNEAEAEGARGEAGGDGVRRGAAEARRPCVRCGSSETQMMLIIAQSLMPSCSALTSARGAGRGAVCAATTSERSAPPTAPRPPPCAAAPPRSARRRAAPCHSASGRSFSWERHMSWRWSGAKPATARRCRSSSTAKACRRGRSSTHSRVR